MHYKFIPLIPRQLEPNCLYVSIERRVAVHLCACGCQEEVVTPLSPAEWEITFDGDSVSLDPSIGNWDAPCQSHYFITRNEVEWMPRFSKERVKRVKQRDKKDLNEYFKK